MFKILSHFHKRKPVKVKREFKKIPQKTNFVFKKIYFPLIAISLFLLGLIIFIIKYQSLQIKVVKCLLENIPCNQAQIQIQNIIGESFLKYDFEPLKTKLFFIYPQIGNIKIKKSFPSTIIFKISLRKPRALIEDKNKNRFFIDEEAMVFSQAATENNSLIIIKTLESVKLGEKIVSPTILFSLRLVNYLESSLLPVKQINIQSYDSIEVSLQNNKTILFTSEKSEAKQVDSLQFILNNKQIDEKKKNIIDLRFENPVVK